MNVNRPRGVLNMTSLVVRVGEDGSLLLPAELFQQLELMPGSLVEVSVADGVIHLSLAVTALHEAAREIERARIEAGISMEEMFAGLREERERYYQEHYGSASA